MQNFFRHTKLYLVVFFAIAVIRFRFACLTVSIAFFRPCVHIGYIVSKEQVDKIFLSFPALHTERIGKRNFRIQHAQAIWNLRKNANGSKRWKGIELNIMQEKGHLTFRASMKTITDGPMARRRDRPKVFILRVFCFDPFCLFLELLFLSLLHRLWLLSAHRNEYEMRKSSVRKETWWKRNKTAHTHT